MRSPLAQLLCACAITVAILANTVSAVAVPVCAVLLVLAFVVEFDAARPKTLTRPPDVDDEDF